MDGLNDANMSNGGLLKASESRFGTEINDSASMNTSKRGKKKKKKKAKKNKEGKTMTEEERLAAELQTLEEKLEVESKQDSGDDDFEFTTIGVKKKEKNAVANFNPVRESLNSNQIR